MNNKVKVADNLSEMLQDFVYNIEEDQYNGWGNDYIVDSLCDMKEILYKDDADEGRFYESYSLVTDKVVKLYETITAERAMTKDAIDLKVMSIESVTPKKDGKMLIEFLAKKVR